MRRRDRRSGCSLRSTGRSKRSLRKAPQAPRLQFYHPGGDGPSISIERVELRACGADGTISSRAKVGERSGRNRDRSPRAARLEVSVDALENILSRRNVGRMREDRPPRDLIAKILEAAVRAPNHYLTQPWRF